MGRKTRYAALPAFRIHVSERYVAESENCPLLLQPHKSGRKSGLSARQKHKSSKGRLAQTRQCCIYMAYAYRCCYYAALQDVTLHCAYAEVNFAGRPSVKSLQGRAVSSKQQRNEITKHHR